MKKQDFLKAIEIISNYHSTEMIINKPVNQTIGNLGHSEFTISIKNCCAGLINTLKSNNYQLSMKDGLLNVDIY